MNQQFRIPYSPTVGWLFLERGRIQALCASRADARHPARVYRPFSIVNRPPSIIRSPSSFVHRPSSESA
jgi:hypothetical protein